MTRRTPGLGRGLGALIPTGPPTSTDATSASWRSEHVGGSADIESPPDSGNVLTAVPGMEFRNLEISRIVPNPRQPRQVFDDVAIAELASSLQQVGFLQPIVVRRAGENFELVAGERRLRAAQLADMTQVPALVRATSDDDLLRDALLENLHRVQLNPLEEAAAYAQLLEDFGCTQDELAGRLGRSRPAVSNSLRLLRLPAPVQRRVAAGVLSAGHAKVLAGITDPEASEALATRIVAEGLSVRAVEEAVALGEHTPGGPRRKRTPRPPIHHQQAQDLADRLDTRVRITGTGGRGRLTIDFASPDDLARILGVLRDPQTWIDPDPHS